MVRKLKETKQEPSIFRVMIEKFPSKYITMEFSTKEEALMYTDSLTSKDTAWYGVYEVNPKAEYLIHIKHNRLRPCDDHISKISKGDTKKEKSGKKKM